MRFSTIIWVGDGGGGREHGGRAVRRNRFGQHVAVLIAYSWLCALGSLGTECCPGLKLRSPMCKTSVLPTVLSFQPQKFDF